MGAWSRTPSDRRGAAPSPPHASLQRSRRRTGRRRRPSRRDRTTRRRTAAPGRRPAPAARPRPSSCSAGRPGRAGHRTDPRRRGAPLPGEPAAALSAAASDLEDRASADVAEEAGRTLAQTLRTPEEVLVAEEGAVLVVVVGGLLVPPRAGRTHRLVVCRVAPQHLVTLEARIDTVHTRH